MRIAAVIAVVTATILCAVSADVHARAARRGRSRQPPPQAFTVPAGIRLLVVAPHPDDETLGAGGLIQRVHATGGTVKVVYLTDGEGYPEGVQVEDHVESPTADDYRGYGKRRRHEALAALRTLGLDSSSATFLRFPDGGLCQLMRRYWSEKRAAYRSPYTRLDRPPKSEMVVPDSEYRGEDLTQELARLIGEFRPTMIVVPRKEDQHADHCAAWFFVADALADVRRVHPEFTTDLLNYIVHFNAWPFGDDRPDLEAPPGLRGGASGWMRLPLSPDEIRTKRKALGRYDTQMKVMDWFLKGFGRTNEIFSRPANAPVTLPTRGSPCCDR
jgi:LmbE family N-acetylglucosaminyl deacetylase